MALHDTDFILAITSAINASRVVMQIYNTEFNIRTKTDGSPITLADEQANAIICEALAKTGITIISEESPKESYQNRKNHEYIWLVDPVDGTKEFTNRNGEFTVNLALIRNQKPVFGVVTAPAANHAWLGWVGKGSYKTDNIELLYDLPTDSSFDLILSHFSPIKTRKATSYPVIAASKSHLTQNTLDMITTLFGDSSNYQLLRKGSSLKYCMLAEGLADYYLRADDINEWDTAAGHAVLLAAGGALITWPKGGELLYNKDSLVNEGFIALADPSLSDILVSKLPL